MTKTGNPGSLMHKLLYIFKCNISNTCTRNSYKYFRILLPFDLANIKKNTPCNVFNYTLHRLSLVEFWCMANQVAFIFIYKSYRLCVTHKCCYAFDSLIDSMLILSYARPVFISHSPAKSTSSEKEWCHLAKPQVIDWKGQVCRHSKVLIKPIWQELSPSLTNNWRDISVVRTTSALCYVLRGTTSTHHHCLF